MEEALRMQVWYRYARPKKQGADLLLLLCVTVAVAGRRKELGARQMMMAGGGTMASVVPF